MIAPETIQSQTFSGHESFPLRFTWLTKAVRGCESPKNRDFLSRDDAMVHLGVGKNMVKAIRFWALSTGVLADDEPDSRASRYRPSELGEFLFGSDGRDPFLEDPATIWLVHWRIATNARLGTWYWLFNEHRATDFHKPEVLDRLLGLANRRDGKQVAVDTIERDLDCFVRTYVSSDPDKRWSREESLDCPLAELGLVRRAGDRETFAFVRGDHESLPGPIFLYALLQYWESTAPQSDSLRFDQVAFGAGSPGMVFKLTENSVVDRLSALEEESDGAFRFDETAGLRQVLRRKRINPLISLRRQYTARMEAHDVSRR